MFEALTDRLQTVFRTLKGHGHLTETELQEGLREIRRALLEADVHLNVAKDLLERVRARAGKEEILKSLTPAQQVIKLLRDELVAILEQGHEARLRETSVPPTVIMMVGLQGSGK
ncbi:MAG TPA: signal recognition particle receptor subunit alpha, partial [Candidatus Polarisedimenticolia bacterium]|nr:signal recognition particle receptor subunit alpha [Candidatus Polarisedimenticolia bacterium]